MSRLIEEEWLEEEWRSGGVVGRGVVEEWSLVSEEELVEE